MLVLGLDTSSPAVSAGLVRLDPPELLAEAVVVDGRRHGELLATIVRRVLGTRPPAELGAVVVGTGPGPFTGLRVGLMTGAALADAMSIPSYGVCSLDAMVGTADAVDRPVVAVSDARRREVYWARYDADGTRVEGPAVSSPADLAEHLRALPSRPLLVGAGALLHRGLFEGFDVDGRVEHPSTARLVGLAAGRALVGAPTESLVPYYLRRPDAVVPTWATGSAPAGPVAPARTR